VEWFRGEYNRISEANLGLRPSVIVHSFGSLIVAKALEKYHDLRVDKIVLTGSIIPADYNWQAIVARKQCGAVLNLKGCKDIWPKIANRTVWGAGNSGSAGFTSGAPVLEETYEKFTHSDTHAPDVFVNKVIPFLAEASPSVDGNVPAHYLRQVPPHDVGIWTAVTYTRQFIERFEAALVGHHFSPREENGAPLSIKVMKLVVVVPKNPAQASKTGRAQLCEALKLKPIAFGEDRERTALLAADGTVYDLPSIANSFVAFSEVHGDGRAAEEGLRSFEVCIRGMVEERLTGIHRHVEVRTLDEVLKNKGA
jgi:pimeloyl-ACP methyl ester carboxylesterase